MEDSKPIRPDAPPRPASGRAAAARRIVEALLMLALFVVYGTTFVVQAFRITSGSLEPTLKVGDFVLVDRMLFAAAPPGRPILPRRPVRRGDLVVFKDPRDPAKDLVKRVIGLPGEKLEIVNKDVLIDDIPLAEPYVEHTDAFIYTRDLPVSRAFIRRDNFGPVTVPDGTLFVLGDNRDDSEDSRFWGPLPSSYVKGRPWLVYFSYEVAGDPARKTSATGRLRNIERPFPTFRFGRIGTLLR